jgi:glucose-6-phosphate 1-dehydrogenase
VLRALRPFDKKSIKKDTVRGQYTRGSSKEGQLPSYLEEIDKYESNTETFVALKTYIENWRWGGVPFYLRTGKRMPHRYSEIVINFKQVPHNIFPEKKNIENNRLTIRLQPEERIELRQMVKIPGPGGYRYKPFSLELDYADHFENRFPDAYERLLMDVARGNQTLFMRRDEVKASWEWTESILKHWKNQKMPNHLYEAGTWGPGDFIMDEGNSWVKSQHVAKIQEKKNEN